jgi:hypothetical protein
MLTRGAANLRNTFLFLGFTGKYSSCQYQSKNDFKEFHFFRFKVPTLFKTRFSGSRIPGASGTKQILPVNLVMQCFFPDKVSVKGDKISGIFFRTAPGKK